MAYIVIYIIGVIIFYNATYNENDGECAQEMATTVSFVWPIALICFLIMEVNRWMRKNFSDWDID